MRPGRQWPEVSIPLTIAASLFLALAIFYLDLDIPAADATATLYVAVILWAYFIPWLHYVYMMAGLTTVMTLLAGYLTTTEAVAGAGHINRFLIITTIWITAIVVDRIQKSSGSFYSAIETAADAIINTNSRGIINTFNLGAQKIFGYTPKEVLGKNIAMLMPHPSREQHDEYISRFLNTGHQHMAGQWREFKAQRKDGSVFPVEVSVIETYQRGNLMFLEIIRDITGRVRAEEQLSILSRAIEQSPASIIITDFEGTIEYVNPKFSETSGYAQDEVLGKNTRILKSGEIPSEEYRSLWDTISSGNEWRGLFHNQKKNGELFWESASVSPIKNQDGDITHFLSVKEDITEQMETERQLAHALKLEATGQLTSGIAHDFNNLLTIIMGNMQLLMDEKNKFARDETTEILNDIYSAAKDGEDLIQRLLLLLRKTKPKTIQFDVNQIILDLKRVLGRMLGEDIRVTINLNEDGDFIHADPNQVESALLNLAVNSRDALPNGGEFRIETKHIRAESSAACAQLDLKPGNYVAIVVTDTGIGMDQHVLEHSREPFFTTKDAGKGSGLGLSMVHNFARQCGGDVLIESSPGKGTTVTVLLAESGHKPEDDSFEPVARFIPEGHETILVVEDNKNVRRFAVRSLQNLGYHVLETDNSNTAMEFLISEGQNIQLLFSDIVIPGNKNGQELAIWLLQNNPEVKAALTTGLRTDSFEELRLPEGIPLLRKPYSLEKLAHFIREQLDLDNSL